tara:strand:+ start:463 stop:726 length:264 start_codon:yes stop_codon:yes gene_type:complete
MRDSHKYEAMVPHDTTPIGFVFIVLGWAVQAIGFGIIIIGVLIMAFCTDVLDDRPEKTKAEKRKIELKWQKIHGIDPTHRQIDTNNK